MSTSDYDVRRLVDDDAEASRALGREAFGHPAPPPGTPAPLPRPGSTQWGAFHEDRLVARAVGYDFGSWFGGRVLSTVGIGSVAVQAEHRGRGLVRELMTSVLDHHRAAGAAVSTLFPTAPAVYRGYGYEVIGSYDEVVVPVSALGRVRRPPTTAVRRATAADGPAIRRVYDTWAAAQNGPSARRGPAFLTADADLVDEHFAVTVVEDADRVVRGYASWERGPGYGSDAHIVVDELLALDADAYATLWSVLGSFSSVTGQVKVYTSGDDVARYTLPTKDWKVTAEDVYMLRVEDVCAALTGIAVPTDLSFSFSVAGDPLEVVDGAYAVVARNGLTTCARTADAPGPVLHPRGLALALAGTQSCSNLRHAGLLSGPADLDTVIDHALGGRQVHVRDYF